MRRILIGLIAAVILIALIAAVLWTRTSGRPTQNASGTAVNPNKAIAASAASPPDDGNWTMPSKDYAATRFSALNQVTPANVVGLKVEFTFSTGTTEGFEAPPLVVNNTM